jgi:hypothetical protein
MLWTPEPHRLVSLKPDSTRGRIDRLFSDGAWRRLPSLEPCGKSPKRPLANARGSVDSARYRAATVRKRVFPKLLGVSVMLFR